jgi:hypothetical protein
MIHHISIDAHNPLQVASTLAEIWHGKVYQFLAPGSYLVMPFDPYGTHIVILDLAPFAFPVRARSARTVNAGFGGASRRRNQLVENAARSE